MCSNNYFCGELRKILCGYLRLSGAMYNNKKTTTKNKKTKKNKKTFGNDKVGPNSGVVLFSSALNRGNLL